MSNEQFTFENNKIQALSLEQLKRTYQELTSDEKPMYGIHHFDAIERIQSLLDKHGMTYKIHSMFAGQNSSRKDPAVIINPRLEQEFGKGSPESHALRRIYTSFHIDKGSDDETTTGLVVSFNQSGLQVAIGPNVKMCTNQCIMSPERMISTYGTNKVSDFDKFFEVIDDWFHNFDTHRTDDLAIINKMKEIEVSYSRTLELIGQMNAMRVLHDTNDAELRKNAPKDYPLTQGQISDFTEDFLKYCLKTEKTDHSLWELYNITTELYKPGVTEMTNIIPQNAKWSELLTQEFELK